MNLLRQQNRYIFFFILFVFFANVTFAQENLRHEEPIKKFLKEYCIYQDPNPTRQIEADSINSLFATILNNQFSPSEVNNLRTKAFGFLYENSIYVFEDEVDMERTMYKKYLCYLCLSLLADSDRNLSFLQDARNSFSEDNYYREKALIDLTEIYLLLKETDISDKEIDQNIITLYNSIYINKEKISDDRFVLQLGTLLKDIRQGSQPLQTRIMTR